MKRFVTICIMLLLSTVAYAQSDCNAPHCGTLPLLQVSNENGGVTDLYLYYNADCEIYFRTRFIPVSGDAPAPGFYQFSPGEDRFIVSNVMGRWADYRGSGAFVLDWATYLCEPTVLTAAIHRTQCDPFDECCTPLHYNIDEPDKYEPGCHWFIQSQSDYGRFHVYNKDDTGIQTLKYEGEYYLIMPGEVVEVIESYLTPFYRLCIGETPPGPSLPGLDLSLPLYIEGLSQSGSGDVHKIIQLK